MIKRAKNQNNNNAVKPLSNTRTLVENINNDVYMMFPGKDAWRQRLIASMYKWLEQETSVELVQFCYEFNIPRRTLNDWREKYPDIKEAVADIMIFLGSKRRIGALTKKFDANVAFRDMHLYDPEWDGVNRYHASLKQLEGPEQGIVFISADPVKVTGKVTPRTKQVEGKQDEKEPVQTE